MKLAFYFVEINISWSVYLVDFVYQSRYSFLVGYAGRLINRANYSPSFSKGEA